jgi:hypothetical protein
MRTLIAAAILVMAPAAQDPDIDALLKKLFSADAGAAAKAEEDLLDLGPKALPHLERAEKEANGEVQRRYRAILQDIRDFEAGLESREFDTAGELVKRLDERAARLRRRLAKESGRPVLVGAVVEKEFGEKLKAPNSYELATFSLEFDTRDVRHVKNDADFFLTDGTIRVRTVTDDRSEIWEEGDARPQLTARAAKGRAYVLHTDDDDTNAWWKLTVLERRPRQWMIFRWESLPVGPEVLKLQRTPDRTLQIGRVRMQIRAGDFDKHLMRLYPDGARGRDLAEVRSKPLDMDSKVGGYDSMGFVEGGLVPVGKVWILRRARVTGDAHREGIFRLALGNDALIAVTRTAKKLDETWTGRVVIRPGDERLVYIEASYYTKCDVTLSGWLCDERLAEVRTFPELKPEEKKRADDLVAALEGPESKRAMQDLFEWGPPVLEYLQSKRSPKADEAVRRINGE